MDIKSAKEEIKNAMKAYFTKDEFGEYCIPIERQRPIFLMGPPGIGKTAIMEQVAQELGVGILSYSMTHHTRQSALGLPFIEKKVYGGKEYSVSEYTMSEIISSVYDMMEQSGLKEGILFLDEINCVSETLAPSMLQFLQYKIFGRHKVPDGWIVVTAGNPPEYNNSVREFDIVTWDRLKRIDIEPNYDVWREYAVNSGVHASITTYLDIKKDDFYLVESTVDGKTFVTARGWYDLSDMIKLYEANGIKVSEDLVIQYLQNEAIAKSFAVYYDLFNKYKSDYQVDSIMDGTFTKEIVMRAKDAKFDEKISLIGLILDKVFFNTKKICLELESINELKGAILQIKVKIGKGMTEEELLHEKAEDYRKFINLGKTANSLSYDKQFVYNKTINLLEEMEKEVTLLRANGDNISFTTIIDLFKKKVDSLSKNAKKVNKELDSMFEFSEQAFGDGQEMVIIVTELTSNRHSVEFIKNYGCDKYFKHNKELLLYERQTKLIDEINDLNLE